MKWIKVSDKLPLDNHLSVFYNEKYDKAWIGVRRKDENLEYQWINYIYIPVPTEFSKEPYYLIDKSEESPTHWLPLAKPDK